ncbi:MAG: MBL fold metallo-hydrolase, partial [Gordonia sp. (in: high G+C Gram-positive bacteria)]
MTGSKPARRRASRNAGPPVAQTAAPTAETRAAAVSEASAQSSQPAQNPEPAQNAQPQQGNQSGDGQPSKPRKKRRSGKSKAAAGAAANPVAEKATGSGVTGDVLDRLPQPGKLPTGGMRIVALGGIGEIGRNMTVFEYDGRLLIVDCGVLFPEDQQPGVDLILPDFRYIEDRVDDIDAVVLTHGHEDHIGAVPFLLKLRSDIPVIGARFTLALVAAKCREHRLRPNLIQVAEGDRATYGAFDCEFFAVNHSIPDALAVAIRTPAGVVLHTGDIKLDQLPLDNRLTDLAGFSRLGDEGVDLFLVDSTNAEVPGFVTPEREIGGVLDTVIGKAKQRVIVASFASHVHRIQQIVDVAHRH